MLHLVFLLWCSSLFGSQLINGKEFFSREQVEFRTQIPLSVNPVTGEYSEVADDLVVASAQPIIYRRVYHNLGEREFAMGRWKINPQTTCFFNFNGLGKISECVMVGEASGSSYVYKQFSEQSCKLESANKFANLSPSGQTHPLNTRISYERNGGDICFAYGGNIVTGDGRKRIFSTESRIWPQLSEDPMVMHRALGPGIFHARIDEEILPNGNVLTYSWKNCNGHGNVSPYYVLEKITAWNHQRSCKLGELNIIFERAGPKHLHSVRKITVKGSDGRKALYQHDLRTIVEKDKSRKHPFVFDVLLHSVQLPDRPQQSYDFAGNTKRHHDYKKTLRNYTESSNLSCTTTADGIAITLAHDSAHRVKSLSSPLGVIASYEYQPNHTIIRDGKKEKTLYRFDEDKRITLVEKYDGSNLAQAEINTWDPLTGNLLKHRIEDGKGIPLLIREYEYDGQHNPKLEKVGDGVNSQVTHRLFSADPFNLLEEESTKKNHKTCYAYVSNTNLPLSQLEYHHEKIVKRVFYFYDSELNSVCTRQIIDDGSTKDPHDLQGVSYRKIIEIIPKRKMPCIGLPEEVLEKTLNAKGSEILLHRVCYTYHPSGKILQEDHFDADNRYRYSIKNTYNEKEQLIAQADALGGLTEFVYNANFKLTLQRGPRPDVHKEWEYDALNRPIVEKEFVDGKALETHKKYDLCNRLETQTDPREQTTHYSYDALGRCISTTYPDGAVERKRYDALGNCIKETDPLGHVTTYTYNFRGQVLSTTYPDGGQEHNTYDCNGLLLTHTNRAETKTVYTYDLFDNCIQTDVYSAQGQLLNTTSAIYSAFSKLSETDAAGVTTYFSYDFAGRLVSKRLGERVSIYTYSSLGELATIQEGDTLTSYIYDVKGQLLEKRVFSDEDLLFEESFAYDALGNQVEHSTACGTTYTNYNTLSQPIGTIDPLGNQTLIHYDYAPIFRKTTTNPHGIAYTEEHNSRGWLARSYTKNTLGEQIQENLRFYDLAGNLTESKEVVYHDTTPKREVTLCDDYDCCGRRIRHLESGCKETLFFYNLAGQLCKTIKPDQTEICREYDALGRLSRLLAPRIDYRYQYDEVGNLLFAGSAFSPTERFYDIYGNVTEEKLANSFNLNHLFDPYGRRKQLTLPDGSQVMYHHKGPYLYQVVRSGKKHTYTKRNLAGLPIQVDLPDGSQLSIDWDPLLRWKNIRSPHYLAAYAYDAVGNLISCCSQDCLGTRSESYTYDNLNQLIEENAHTYQHDSLHNRLAKDEATYEMNALNQLMGEYTYDANGNLTFDGRSTYEYDALDRLIVVRNILGEWKYIYDAFNRRISKIGPQTEEHYIWDGQQEIGTPHKVRILGDGLSESGSCVFIELGKESYIPLHDIQGSVIALIKDGQPHAALRYTAFGEPLHTSNLSPWGFAGKRLDEETGFVYFGRRFYSPSLGRWVTPDPLEDIDGLNLYAYLSNSPLTSFDLYGLMSFDNSWSLQDDYMPNIRLALGNLFGFGLPRDYSNFENSFSNKSRIFDLNQDFGFNFKEPPIGAYFFGNGAGNTFYDLKEKAYQISSYSGYNTRGVYNATHTLPIDGHEALANLNSYAITPPVALYHQAWDQYFDHDTSGAPVLQICHSQGSPQLRNSLEGYPKERRDRIIVAVYAPLAYISKELCMDVHHYACPSDPITYIDAQGRRECKDTITYIPRMRNCKQSCHEWLNPIYSPYLEREIINYQEKLKGYAH